MIHHRSLDGTEADTPFAKFGVARLGSGWAWRGGAGCGWDWLHKGRHSLPHRGRHRRRAGGNPGPFSFLNHLYARQGVRSACVWSPVSALKVLANGRNARVGKVVGGLKPTGKRKFADCVFKREFLHMRSRVREFSQRHEETPHAEA
jgi:hypothetical protein